MSYYDFDENTPAVYTISFEMTKGDETRHVFEGIYAEDTPWSVFMQRFVEFLEGTGYVGVSKRVSLEHSPFIEDNWFGPVHDAEDKDDWK